MEESYIDGASNLYEDFLEQQKMETTKYRKLTDEELESFGFVLKDSSIIKGLNKLYAQFFNTDIRPCTALVLCNSEYNDCNYQNRLVGVIFYDKQGNELLPSKSKSITFRKHVMNNLSMSDIGLKYETHVPQDDLRFTLELPDLYVKVE